ncbi:hypothetical protein, partial [Bifidobacterium longum]|uniref:hypothetical protein n=1 Tax=Bifidobacterium longum TaxID=216816 RepID=UPI001BE46971
RQGVALLFRTQVEGPERDYLLGSGNDVFSGMLIPNRAGVVILINDSHSIQRQRATFCHEIAILFWNILLKYPFPRIVAAGWEASMRRKPFDLEPACSFQKTPRLNSLIEIAPMTRSPVDIMSALN